MIYVLLADGFEEIEALEPVDILRRAGLDVLTCAIKDKTVTGAHGIKVIADILIDDVDKNNIEILMLPGGSGHTNLDNSEKVHELIDYSAENNILISAICAAPSILGKKGLLKGKKATCFPGFEKFLIGATVCNDKVIYDGNFITARGAGAASDFGFKMVEILKGKDVSDKLKEVMQY